MKMEGFLIELADLLEVEVLELDDDYQLDENENWDSLTLISVIVMIDEHFKISLVNNSLKDCRCIRDLKCIIEEKISGALV